VTRLRVAALLRVSLRAAVSISLAGIIGFVGLTGPHIARMPGVVIPIGIVTALLGLPAFFPLLMNRRKLHDHRAPHLLRAIAGLPPATGARKKYETFH
jgi:ABC-type Fe3+-siderophore transport system permease subunit